MTKLRRLLYVLIISISIAGFGVTAATAADQICFRLLPPEGSLGSGPTILKLGVMDYGNNHFALAGTEIDYAAMPNFPPVDTGLVHGNAEVINDKVEISLDGTSMSSDNKTAAAFFYHLRVDPTSGSGTYTIVTTYSPYTSSTATQTGSVSVVSCEGY